MTQATTTATQPAAKRKGRPGLCPATASTPSRWNRLTQRSMVRELQNSIAATVGPGVAVGQEQEDVGAEADLGVGVLAISVEQRLALPGVEGRRYGSWVRVPGAGIELVYSIVQASSTFPVAWTYLEQARYRRSNSASNWGRLVLDRAFLMILRRSIA